MLGLLQNASRQYGQSIAMVTHDPIAASYADRVIFLADGTVVEDRARMDAAEISTFMLAHGGAGMTARRPRLVRTPLREHVPSVLVAALSAAFGVGLLQITGFLAAAIAGDDVTGSSGTVALMLQIVAIVFIVIAVYVSAIITANTFATIVAGRARSIALLRLLGSSASAQRRAIATEGLFVGVAGTRDRRRRRHRGRDRCSAASRSPPASFPRSPTASGTRC